MRTTTGIAGRDVEIKPGEIVTINFTGGPNPGDAGPKDFWTASNKKSKVTVRWREGEDPGERFLRIGKGEKGWATASTANAIHPATQKEVIDWLKKHPEDAPFAESCRVGERSIRLVKTEDGFRFE